jgi:hypothetical protein
MGLFSCLCQPNSLTDENVDVESEEGRCSGLS